MAYDRGAWEKAARGEKPKELDSSESNINKPSREDIRRKANINKSFKMPVRNVNRNYKPKRHENVNYKPNKPTAKKINPDIKPKTTKPINKSATYKLKTATEPTIKPKSHNNNALKPIDTPNKPQIDKNTIPSWVSHTQHNNNSNTDNKQYSASNTNTDNSSVSGNEFIYCCIALIIIFIIVGIIL